MAAATGLAAADDFDRAVASLMILQNNKVQKDIGITTSQRDKMNVHAKTFNDGMNKLGKDYEAALKKDPKAKPDGAKQQKLVVDFKTKVLALLSDSQIKRLREISLQALGVGALGDTMVAKKVGLSGSQTTKVREALTAGLNEATKIQTAARQKLTQGLKEPKTEAEKKKVAAEIDKRMKQAAPKLEQELNAIRSSTEKKVLAVLSSSQKSTWNALLGKLFKP